MTSYPRSIGQLLTWGLVAAAMTGVSVAQTRHVPSIDDLLAVKTLGGAQISPDGRFVAYTVNEADVENDAFVTQLWIAPVDGGAPYQLTRGSKSVAAPRWSPDSRWLAFTSPRINDRNQIFAIRPDGGEAIQLTAAESAVSDFAWSLDGTTIAFTAPEPDSTARKARKDHLGDFDVIRRDYAYAHIWTLDVAAAFKKPSAGTQRTKGREFSVSDLAWSPDGTRIAFGAMASPDLVQSGTSDIYLLDARDDGANKVTRLVAQPGPDGRPRWSPDGTRIAFQSAMGRADFYHANGRIAIVGVGGGTPESITDGFDEDPNLQDWRADGIYFTALQKTASHLFRIDPQSRKISRLTEPDALLASGFSLSPDGSRLAFVAASPTSLAELFVTSTSEFAPRKLTDMSAQLEPLIVGKPEIISWKSQDGAVIEGVLVKPADFEASKRYPLFVQIHGGPTGIDRPVPLGARYYPTDIWLARGALLLKVNYRGSAGYGERFRQLNVRNLGVGDAWDVVSGIDALVARGWVDASRVGCMGWSQGGYISAFLTTSTTRCTAVSVGAGISNWATYYYNTDITPFTVQYLGDDPADDPDIYRKTSPMTFIKQAKTPTLIQHGENDRRVPIANAFELRQGLEDRGVPVEMVVYKGFGHGITKPRAMRAVMHHNLLWFNHYLWGDPRPDLTNPDVPARADGTKP